MKHEHMETDFAAAFEAGRGAADLKVQKEGDGVPFVALPEDRTITTLEHLLPEPTRLRSTVRIDVPADLARYIERFRDSGSVVFVQGREHSIVSVLDYHLAEEAIGENQPRGCEHRAWLKAVKTPAWMRWELAHKKRMGQLEFVEFLEENLSDIAVPDGADLLDMCTTFSVRRDIAFSTSVRLANGDHQLTYTEATTETSTRTGNVQIPENFTLGLRPFEGNEMFQVRAKLRYRIADGGKLSLWFEVHAIEDVLDHAFQEIVAKVREGVSPDLLFVNGTPPGIAEVWKA